MHRIETAILPETERVNKIRGTSIAPVQLITNSTKKPTSAASNVFYANGKAHGHAKHRAACIGQQAHQHHHQQQPLNELFIRQKQSIEKNQYVEIDRKNMEFLIPRAPNAATAAATCQSQAALSNIVAQRFTLNDIKSHLSDNFKIIQSTAAPPQKMTKKQLKLAQAQLDKLTQINIHLQGMLKRTKARMTDGQTGRKFIQFKFY